MTPIDFTDPDHAHIRDLVSAHVLGAVTPDEERLVDEHVARCAACRTVADELREVRDLLPALVSEQEPSPALKERIMAVVHAEVLEASERARAGQGGAEFKIPTAPVRRRRWAPITIAAAVLIALVAGAINSIVSPGSQVVRVYAMEGTAAWPGAHGSLRYHVSDKRLELHMQHLKSIDKKYVYELWLLKGKTPVAIGAFHPDVDGTGNYVTHGTDVSSFTAAALTVERAPLARTPSHDLMAKGALE